MRADDWIISYLIKKGVTDIFGIPGVVIMDFIYAANRRKPELTPHLCFHEQGGAFAANGYAQASGKVGIAYATRGPGMTNMLTAMADAYYDSIPVMYFTAHSSKELDPRMRVLNNQEIDTVALAKVVTKKAIRIDTIEDLQKEVMMAYSSAVSGRKGPVFLDILSSLFSYEVEDIDENNFEIPLVNSYVSDAVSEIKSRISKAKRPVILIGNGTRYGNAPELLKSISEKACIPILSSRTAQDVVPGFPMYFGFVGSRATRYSNFILSKADLIISLGNRMAFPIQSKSFRPVLEKSFTIRVDIDAAELTKNIPNSINFSADAVDVLQELSKLEICYDNSESWVSVCNSIKNSLFNWDEIPVITCIKRLIESSSSQSSIVCDVGNHSFWVTTAYAYSGRTNRVLYSGSFGALGCALPKAIGACYSTGAPSLCFVGDQGLQMNIQELQQIVADNVPVIIVAVNNSSSGMIKERERAKYGERYVQTTMESGYSYPDYQELARAYGIHYRRVISHNVDVPLCIKDVNEPLFLELMVDENTELYPYLPAGNVCQNLFPELPKEMYNYLNSL